MPPIFKQLVMTYKKSLIILIVTGFLFTLTGVFLKIEEIEILNFKFFLILGITLSVFSIFVVSANYALLENKKGNGKSLLRIVAFWVCNPFLIISKLLKEK